MTKNKMLISLVIIGMIGLVVFYAFTGKPSKQPTRKSFQVDVISTKQATFNQSITSFGHIKAIRSADLRSHFLERIIELNYLEGGFVAKDSIIAVLVNDEETADLKAEEAQLDEHKRELKRLGTLLTKNVAAQREFDERKTQKQISLAKIQSLKAKLSKYTLRAPFAGFVSIHHLSVGSVVDPGDIIATVNAVSKVRLDIKIPSRYLSDLKVGQTITATSDVIPEKVFEGSISAIDHRIDANTHSVLVRAILDNPEQKLTPGLLMSININIKETDNISVPEEAVFQKAKQHFVYVITKEGKTVEQRPVSIGTTNKGNSQITSGLQSDEWVVIRGIHRIFPNMRVSVNVKSDNTKPNSRGV